jgi:hypothetical protein
MLILHYYSQYHVFFLKTFYFKILYIFKIMLHEGLTPRQRVTTLSNLLLTFYEIVYS